MTNQTTFASLNKEARKAKQQVIIDAAERVFASKAFNQVSMRDIAGEAAVSHATIYRYFPDKQALLVEAFVRGIREIITSIRTSSQKDPGDEIREAAELFVDFLSRNDHYFKMMSHFMLNGDLSLERVDRLNATVRPLLDQFEIILKRLGAEKDTRCLAHCFFAALNGILITFRDYPGRSPEDVRYHMRLLAQMTARLFEQGSAGWK